MALLELDIYRLGCDIEIDIALRHRTRSHVAIVSRLRIGGGDFFLTPFSAKFRRAFVGDRFLFEELISFGFSNSSIVPFDRLAKFDRQI